MRVVGIETLSAEQRLQAERDGGRYVFFEYCISLVFISLRRPSAIYFLHQGRSGFLLGLRYSVVSLLLGWWGLPWGIIYTPLTILTNMMGGEDVTEQVSETLRALEEDA